MEVKHNVMDHPFILEGMKPGDWFLGCTQCGIQLPTNAAGVPLCPNCNGALNMYTVTVQDITARDAK